MKRKSSITLLAIAIAAIFASCGNNDKQVGTKTEPKPDAPTIANAKADSPLAPLSTDANPPHWTLPKESSPRISAKDSIVSDNQETKKAKKLASPHILKKDTGPAPEKKKAVKAEVKSQKKENRSLSQKKAGSSDSAIKALSAKVDNVMRQNKIYVDSIGVLNNLLDKYKESLCADMPVDQKIIEKKGKGWFGEKWLLVTVFPVIGGTQQFLIRKAYFEKLSEEAALNNNQKTMHVCAKVGHPDKDGKTPPPIVMMQ